MQQVGKSSLTAETIRIWVTPPEKKPDTRADPDIAAEGAKIQPKKLLALHEVEFADPQIRGQTDRLEIWFEDGVLPGPPLAQESRRVPHLAARPEAITVSRVRQKSPAISGVAELAQVQKGGSGLGSGELSDRQTFAFVADSPRERPLTNGRTSPSASNGRMGGKPLGKTRGKQPEKITSKPSGKPVPRPIAKPIEKEPELSAGRESRLDSSSGHARRRRNQNLGGRHRGACARHARA